MENTNLNPKTDFRAFLVEELRSRKNRNSHYSMRAFARDIGISPSRLTSILKGTYGLSPSAALQIAPKLEIDQQQRVLFVSLVTKAHARSRKERVKAEQEYSAQVQSQEKNSLEAVKKLIGECIEKVKGSQVNKAEIEEILSTANAELDKVGAIFQDGSVNSAT